MTAMKLLFIALLALLSNIVTADEKITSETVALLCSGQTDNRIRLIDPLSKTERKTTLWCYPTDDGKPFPHRPRDAKRVELDGVVHILVSYKGSVRLIRFNDKKVIKEYTSYKSCHSAEILPDGTIVTASSEDGKLRVHRSENDFTDLELPYAHGLVWDKKGKQLWALGDVLYRFNYNKGKLILIKKYKLPMTPTGHDLFPTRDGKKLLVSNNDALFLFDLKAEAFEKISDLAEIKSASEHQDGSIWASDPKDMEKSGSWQSDSVIQIKPEAKMRYTNKGAKFYKARWWQKVAFSY